MFNFRSLWRQENSSKANFSELRYIKIFVCIIFVSKNFCTVRNLTHVATLKIFRVFNFRSLWWHENCSTAKFFRITVLLTSVGQDGLPRKQNGRPIGYITLLTLISRPKRTLSHLRRLIYGLLRMAKLAEPLMGVRNTSKVPSRKLAKSHFLLLILTEPQIFLFLTTAIPYWGIHFFTTNLI